MPSERIKRRIDGFLDEAEEALAINDWSLVVARCRAVLAIDPENEDAAEYIAAAERAMQGSGSGNGHTSAPETTETTATGAVASPASFAAGRYDIIKPLGEGGKKKVYLAHDNTLDIDVALAQIKTDGLDETGRERIRREAQAMARLGTHRNVMPIYDLSEENGQPFMVQPLMSGGDVEGLIEAAGGSLELEKAIEVASQAAEGLAYAHSKGIVHRDLKPGNVWLDEEGVAKIGDFGLAVATNRTRITVEKVMVGTVSYMPPEQATGGDITPRADLYSLGVMLYEMCTGRVPFMGDDDIAVISQHINTPPVAPSWHNAAIPKTLDSLILRLMSKDPAERPESAEEVLAALESVDLSAAAGEADEKGTGSLDSMAGGVFVGRHREMDHLKATFEEVLSGRGRMVVLVGEPGIGKTRTAQELATYARMRGAQVLWGMSYEGGGEPSYWPWVRAMRDLVADMEPAMLRTQLGAVAPVIADLVPDIRTKLPDIPEAIQIEDAESARFRLFDSVAMFLKMASQARALVVMLEDLHWADRPSLALLEFIAHEMANSRLMIVGNYRDVELSRRHPLAVTLGELGRQRQIERVQLRGLQRHDVARFIEIAAGINPPAALVDAVHRQTEGNPLFVTETVRLLVQEGDLNVDQPMTAGTTSWEIRIPEGVREVIGRRLDRLSERCNEVLTTAAVIGRRFHFRVLLSLIDDITENVLLDALDEALGSRIIEELPDDIGLYQFTHALMQETLTSELSANRIVRMHARIAESLEEFYGDEAETHASELCEHFAEAETVLGPERVIKYALVAGREAAAAFAWDDALRHFQRAIAAKEASLSGSSRAVADEEMAVILRHLRRAQNALLMRTEADATMRRLHEHYVATGEVSKAIAVLCETQAPSADLVEASLKLVPSDSHDAGWLLAWHGRILGLSGHQDDAEDAFYNAMAIAQREADQELALRIMINSNEVDLTTQQYGVEAVEKGQRYIEIAKQAGNRLAEAEAQIQTTWNAMYVGDPDAARAHAQRHSVLAEELRLRSLRRVGLGVSSSIAQSLGNFAEAKRLAEEGIEIEGDFQLVGRLANVELELGNFEAAEPWLERLETAFHEMPGAQEAGAVAGQSVAVLARTCARALRCGLTPEFTDEARRIMDERTWNGLTIPENPNLQVAHIVFKVHFDDKEGLREIVDALTPHRNIFIAPFAHVGHLMGLACSHLADYAAAESLFDEAVEDCTKAGYRPELAWTLADYAEMRLERGEGDDRERAWELQSQALEIASELGMQPLVKRIVATREHRGA